MTQALTNVHVVDVTTGKLLENATITWRGDEILSVGTGEVPEVSGDVLDGGGGYVLPGLFDLHAHVIPMHPAFTSAKPPEATLHALLDAGVTSVRCLPLWSESAVLWAARVNAGELEGPHIVPTSHIFELRPQRTKKAFGDPATARQWVLREASLGSRWIKVYNAMDEASLSAIVEACRVHGMRVCGHAQDLPPHVAAQLGMHSIEHFTGFPRSIGVDPDAGGDAKTLPDRVAAAWKELDPERTSALLATLRERGTAWVPTIVVGEAIGKLGTHDGEQFAAAEDFRAAVEKAARLAVRAHREGVLVGCGTDFPMNGVVAGDSVHRELELLVEMGDATPAEALAIATCQSAEVLGYGEWTGRVAKGYRADFLLLPRNPLEDVSAVRDLTSVWLAGQRVRGGE